MSSSSTSASRERSASPGRKPAPPASNSIHLDSIKTIGQLFQEGVLKEVEGKVRTPADGGYLERVSLFQGDITKLDVDAIVNAANKSLLGGGGVDGAIHNAAGPKLLAECRQLNGCLTGQSKITRGYKLPARHVIHTVGPVYSSSDVETKAEQLASCYKTSLQLAVENSLKHVAFPSISTGIYGYPIEDATHIALQVARDFCESEDGAKLDRIIFVVWSNRDKGVYETLIPEYFPPVQTEAASGEQTAESSEAGAPKEDAPTVAEVAAPPAEAAGSRENGTATTTAGAAAAAEPVAAAKADS